MRFFLSAAALTAKRLLRRPATLLVAGILAASCLLLSLFFAGEQALLGIRVGILMEEDDPFAGEIFSRLLAYDGPIVFERHSLADREEVEALVITGELECAYLLEPGLREKIVFGRARDAITLLHSPRSVANTLAGQMVYAAVMSGKMTDMTAELLRDTLGYSPEEAAEIAAEKVAYYEAQDIFLAPELHYITADGVVGEAAPIPAGSRLLHGVLALFLLGGAIWAVPSLIRENPRITAALPSAAARGYLLGVASALFFTGLITGLLGLGVIALIYPAGLGALPAELLWLFLYTLALGVGGTALSRFLRRDDFVYGGGVFLMIVTALLGGVMIDLGEIGPFLGALSRAFVTTGYIAGTAGTGSALDGIAIFALLALGALVLAVPRKA